MHEFMDKSYLKYEREALCILQKIFAKGNEREKKKAQEKTPSHDYVANIIGNLESYQKVQETHTGIKQIPVRESCERNKY